MAIIVFLNAAIQAGTPLLFATTGEILTEKSGNLNLGVEGLMLIGAVFGFLAGHLTNSPILAVLAAALSGALCGLLFAWLTVSYVQIKLLQVYPLQFLVLDYQVILEEALWVKS